MLLRDVVWLCSCLHSILHIVVLVRELQMNREMVMLLLPWVLMGMLLLLLLLLLALLIEAVLA